MRCGAAKGAASVGFGQWFFLSVVGYSPDFFLDDDFFFDGFEFVRRCLPIVSFVAIVRLFLSTDLCTSKRWVRVAIKK